MTGFYRGYEPQVGDLVVISMSTADQIVGWTYLHAYKPLEDAPEQHLHVRYWTAGDTYPPGMNWGKAYGGLPPPVINVGSETPNFYAGDLLICSVQTFQDGKPVDAQVETPKDWTRLGSPSGRKP